MRGTVETLLRALAADGHSRTSAHKEAGISWHTFRRLCADHPQIKWRTKGKQMPGRAPGNRRFKA